MVGALLFQIHIYRTWTKISMLETGRETQLSTTFITRWLQWSGQTSNQRRCLLLNHLFLCWNGRITKKTWNCTKQELRGNPSRSVWGVFNAGKLLQEHWLWGQHFFFKSEVFQLQTSLLLSMYIKKNLERRIPGQISTQTTKGEHL